MSIKVAVVGVGNCASSLVQALAQAHVLVRTSQAGAPVVGVTHPLIAGYGLADIDIVAAFDVDAHKVGFDVADAIFASPNCTTRYVEVPRLGVKVTPGIPLDGVADTMRAVVSVSAVCNSMSIEQAAEVLKGAKAEVVLLFLPVGATSAAEAYARAALAAGCSLVNFTPAPLATSQEWVARFEDAGLVVLGDDTKSQVGSTVVHRALLSLLIERGIRVTESYQLNVGGNTDFQNMSDQSRAAHKVKTKLASLRDLTDVTRIPISAGPTGCIPHLRDHKVGYIHIGGVGLLGMPVSLEVRLKVEDSPNAAAVAVNAIRVVRVATDRNLSGTVGPVCAHLFKNSPRPMNEADARRSFDEFVTGESGDTGVATGSGTAPCA